MTMIEGIYGNGRVELTETPPGLEDGDAAVVHLQGKTDTLPDRKPKRIWRGMFAEMKEFSDEDFKSAEFHGDSDDGLDWSGR